MKSQLKNNAVSTNFMKVIEVFSHAYLPFPNHIATGSSTWSNLTTAPG